MLVEEGLEYFVLCVMAANRKLFWRKLKNVMKTKKVNLASEDDVCKLTQCFPGAVPPFGSAFGIKTFVDNSLIEQGDTINFNCGLRTQSLCLMTKEYLAYEKPIATDFVE